MSGTCTPMGQGGAGGQGGTAGVGGSAGAGETGGSTGGNDPTTDTGCGCRTVDDSRTASAPWLLLTGLLLARARRRSH